MSATDKTLLQLRTAIDEVDQRLVQAINDRSKLAVERARIHRAQTGARGIDQHSEVQAVQNVVSKNQGPIPNSALEGAYREILNGAFVLG
ncbi:chorismate mutase, partial [Mariniblastus sp.]|nr:chorismate mutase [Mariniblastus sp.]